MTTSWRVTTQLSPAPNLDSPLPSQSPTRHSAPRLPLASPSPRTLTTRARGPEKPGERQARRKSSLHSTNTSFPSRTPSRRTYSLRCRQRALWGTEPLRKMLQMWSRCCRRDVCLTKASHTHSSRCWAGYVGHHAFIVYKPAAKTDFKTEWKFDCTQSIYIHTSTYTEFFIVVVYTFFHDSQQQSGPKGASITKWLECMCESHIRD